MDTNSCVLIIIPTYNRANYLPEAINSVLEQDYPDKKILVVDDGSVDETQAVCAEYSKQYGDKVSYHYKKNGGTSSARNAGLDMLGEEIAFVCFLDSDDRLLPGKLGREVALLREHPDAGFTYSDSIVFDESSGLEERQAVAGAGNPDEFFLQHFLTNSSKPAAILYRADQVKTQRFRDDINCSEDTEYLQRIARHAIGIYSSEPGCWVRWHQNSQSRNLIETLKAVLRVKQGVIVENPEFYKANKAAIDQLIEKTRTLLAAQLLLARRWDEVRLYSDNPFVRAQANLHISWVQQFRLRLNLWLNKRHLKHH